MQRAEQSDINVKDVCDEDKQEEKLNGINDRPHKGASERRGYIR